LTALAVTLAVQNILSDLFASLSIVMDNLVIELGVLILIFLGWQYLLAELIGGLVLIVISSIFLKITYPENWLSEARVKVSHEAGQEEDFDWLKRISQCVTIQDLTVR
jgi:hypothetical protein